MQKKEGASRLLIWFLTQMKILQEIIDSQRLETFPENVYDGVCLNKIVILHCTDNNPNEARFIIDSFRRSMFQKYIPGCTIELFPHDSCKIGFYKILGKFLWDIFVIASVTKLHASNLWVKNFT